MAKAVKVAKPRLPLCAEAMAKILGIDTPSMSALNHTPSKATQYRTNHTIAPLFHIDAAGTLSMTERMAKRLDVAQMGHIGQNIRILTQDEH
eukprot:scaffold1771_cov121-Isochrysis_galbana.AAC.3